jgi:hypothetical protein
MVQPLEHADCRLAEPTPSFLLDTNQFYTDLELQDATG